MGKRNNSEISTLSPPPTTTTTTTAKKTRFSTEDQHHVDTDLINLMLPIERLLDILSLCEEMKGMNRSVCSHWKTIIDMDSKDSKMNEQGGEKKYKTMKYAYFSNISSYEWMQKQTDFQALTPLDLCEAIKHKTISHEVAKIAFQITLLTDQVLFALGETGSIELLDTLAQNWPFVITKECYANSWRKFIYYAFAFYSDSVLEWLNKNQGLFFHINKKTEQDFRQNCSDFFQSFFHQKSPKRFTSADKFLKFLELFPEPRMYYGFQFFKFPTLRDYIRVFTHEKAKMLVDFPPTSHMEIRHIASDGRLKYIDNWDQLNDCEKIQHLESFVIDLTNLCDLLSKDKTRLMEDVKFKVSRVFLDDFFRINWHKGLEWLIKNDYVKHSFPILYDPTTEEIISLITCDQNKGKLCSFVSFKNLIPRLLVSQNVQWFKQYIIKRYSTYNITDRYQLKIDQIALHSVVGKWLIEKHYNWFLRLFVSANTTNPHDDQNKFFSKIFPDIRGTLVTDEIYERIVFCLNIINRGMFHVVVPPVRCYIAVNIANGNFGDHKIKKELHSWLFEQFESCNNGLSLYQYNLMFKDLFHLKAMFPILTQYITDEELVKSVVTLPPHEYKDGLNFLQAKICDISLLSSSLPDKNRFEFFTVLKHHFNIHPNTHRIHKFVRSLLERNQLEKYSAKGAVFGSNELTIIFNNCINKGSVYHIQHLFKNKLIHPSHYSKISTDKTIFFTDHQLNLLKEARDQCLKDINN